MFPPEVKDAGEICKKYNADGVIICIFKSVNDGANGNMQLHSYGKTKRLCKYFGDKLEQIDKMLEPLFFKQKTD